MKLRVVHTTTYRYGEPVTTSHHDARLSPRDREHQRVLSHEVDVVPQAESYRRRFDYFGNRALGFSVSEPHRALQVTARSVVELMPAHSPPLDASPAWEEVRRRLREDRHRDLLDAYSMTFDSPRVPILEALRAYAEPSFPAGRPLFQAVRELVGRIHADFRYDGSATEVHTPVEDVLRDRRGVCQDFAHVAIGCLRSLGLPARYVSGYLLTRPPPGRPKLVGADASHAWFATFAPGHGWLDFDPTNDLLPADEHVTVAFGRDYDDVTPIRGVILGGGAHELAVSVDVDPVPADDASPSP
jgi:transglutaminase-like putative cysteine protease